MDRPCTAERAFTLIELSIVLVVIGLLVGGVLVGQDMVHAAGTRATITQVDKFNAAVNTFRGKYGYLPGDIKDPDASSFGFQARGQYAGEGDGNFVIDGVEADAANYNSPKWQSAGETAVFWVDLSTALLIEGGFSTASTHIVPSGNITTSTMPAISAYLPPAKLGRGNYIYVWNGAGGSSASINFFGLSAVTQIAVTTGATTNPALTVQEAASIDRKVDDGLPRTGNVMAWYQSVSGTVWAAGGGGVGATGNTATLPSATTCYDNGGVAGTFNYSAAYANGSNVNCALSFRFQ